MAKRIDRYLGKILNLKDALDNPKYPELTSLVKADIKTCLSEATTRVQRILGFCCFVFVGILCFTLAALYIPVLLFKARKFALLYTMGSLFTICRLEIVDDDDDGDDDDDDDDDDLIEQNYMGVGQHLQEPGMLFIPLGPNKSLETPFLSRASAIHGGILRLTGCHAVLRSECSEHAPHSVVCCGTSYGATLVLDKLHTWWSDGTGFLHSPLFIRCHKYRVKDVTNLTFQNMSDPPVAQPGQLEHFWTPILEHVVAASPKLPPYHGGDDHSRLQDESQAELWYTMWKEKNSAKSS
ncbi:unnamed protein product, partial [Timema podura]|nr:unnamed protein product [Timema podura]